MTSPPKLLLQGQKWLEVVFDGFPKNNVNSNRQIHAFTFCNFCRTQVRSLATLVTKLTYSSLLINCLIKLIDVTLAFEDANSKFVEVVTVADVDAEDRVGNSLLQIWGLRIRYKAGGTGGGGAPLAEKNPLSSISQVYMMGKIP